jgi:hypothetical protein
MAQYKKKKPTVVDAIQFYEDWYFLNKDKYYDYGLCDKANLSEIWFNQGAKDGRYYVSTSKGNVLVSNGDYLVKEDVLEFDLYRPVVFEATYERM